MNAALRVEPHSTASTGITGWFTFGRFALILAALIAAAFPAVVSAQRTFVFSDYGLFGYPLAYHHRQSFWQGEVPLWNPLNDCGLPFLAQWNTLVCYPVSLIYLLFPLPWSLGFFSLIHLFLAGLGMYLLAHHWSSNRLAGSVAGVTYAFSGLALNSLMWPNNIAALGWMPWVIYFLERGWRRGGYPVFQAGFVGAMQMLTGAPEIILFTWTVALLLCAMEWLRGGMDRKVTLQRFASVGGMVGGLAALQLLPFLDLLAHSNRELRSVNAESAMPVTGWANFLAPLFRCYQSPPGLFFQPGQFWTGSYYLSLGIVAIALSSVWLVRQRRVWWLAGLTGLSLILALGDQAFLYSWLRRVFPPLNLVNFPVKFVILVTFCVPLLAAFAIQAFHSATDEKKCRAVRAGLLIGVSLIVLLVTILGYARHFPKTYEQWPAIRNNSLMRAGFLTLTLGILYGFEQLRQQRRQLSLGLGLVALIWLDGVTHVPRLNPTVQASVYETGLAPFKQFYPLPRHGVSRVMLSPEALSKFRTALLPDVANTYLGHRLGLYFNCNLLEEIPKVDGFYSLYLSEQLDVLFAVYAPTNDITTALADFIGVSQISSTTNLVEWTTRSTYLPFATAGQKPIFADKTNTLRGLVDSGFNPRTVVYLPTEAKPLISATNQTKAKILASRFTPHEAKAQIEARQPSLLVFAQSFYHPWRAHIDGRAATLWRANHAFQALEVPAGAHTVTLTYEDRAFRYGATVSSLTLLGTVIARFGRIGLCSQRRSAL